MQLRSGHLRVLGVQHTRYQLEDLTLCRQPLRLLVGNCIAGHFEDIGSPVQAHIIGMRLRGEARD